MPLTMFDAVTVPSIPRPAAAVAGYVDGWWPTFPQLVSAFPASHRLSIAVSAAHDADCLDIENGDATPAQVSAWVARQHARGLSRPWLYASLSVMPAVLTALRVSGIARSSVLLWTAHYTGVTHICDARDGATFGFTDTADATQYASKGGYDASLCSDACFGGAPPPPAPAPHEDEDVVILIAMDANEAQYLVGGHLCVHLDPNAARGLVVAGVKVAQADIATIHAIEQQLGLPQS